MGPTTPPRIFVTGATGLLGERIAVHLMGHGAQVVGLVRTPGRAPPGVLERVGDLHRPVDWSEMLEGIDVAVHSASVVPDWGPYRHLRALSARAHRDLVGALIDAHVRRLVLISAATVYGPGLAGEVDEDQPRVLTGDLCGDTKVDAEAIAWEAHARGDLEVCVIRPPTAYGPGDRAFLPRLSRWIASGGATIVGDGGLPASLVHADEVAQIVTRASTHRLAPGQAFHVADRTLLPWREVLRVIAVALGVRPPSWHIPVLVARLAARVCVLMAYPAQATRPPLLTPHAVEILTSRMRLSLVRAARLLGYAPTRSTAQGLSDVLIGGMGAREAA